eukprot:6185586-Pleurochrysis_carterae.AAC.2
MPGQQLWHDVTIASSSYLRMHGARLEVRLRAVSTAPSRRTHASVDRRVAVAPSAAAADSRGAAECANARLRCGCDRHLREKERCERGYHSILAIVLNRLAMPIQKRPNFFCAPITGTKVPSEEEPRAQAPRANAAPCNTE